MEDSCPKEITIEDLALFKDASAGAGCEDTELKSYTIKRIASLAKALGPQRTVEELLEFIDSQSDISDDEISYGLIEESELFLPSVGGPDHCHESFCILSRISRSVDETLVRNRAVEAIKKSSSDIDQHLTEKFSVASLVGNNDNVWFSEKCSTLSLIPVCYAKACPENKILLRHKYCQIYEDNSASVRKLAAMGLPEFINVLEIEHVSKEFVPLLNAIVEDEQEAVRISAIDIALSIAGKSKNQEVRNDMFEIIRKECEKKSWRIRQKIATTISDIASVFAEEDFIGNLSEMYDNLINDSETEVRIGAVLNLYNFAESLKCNSDKTKDPKRPFEEIFSQELMPIILSITTDFSNEVQIAFSSVILSFGLLIPDDIFKDTILSIVINGLEKDKPLSFKENILMNLSFLPKDVDLIKSLSSIKSIIKHIMLASETSWRTRRSSLVSFVHVSNFCSPEYFQSNSSVYYILLLKDNIYAVRRTASIISPISVKRFGVRWFIREVFPQIVEMLKSKKYSMRYVVLFCIQESIFPTVLATKEDQTYTKELKGLEEADGRILRRLSSLNHKLRSELEKDPFEGVTATYTDEYNIGDENIRVYSEELLDSIMKNQVDVFSICPSGSEELCYLEGILLLSTRGVSNILKTMLDDPTENVRDRTKYVSKSIQEFSNRLGQESSQYSSKIEDVWDKIDEEIEEEINRAVIDSENADKIDTDLMDTISTDSVVESGGTKMEVPKLEVFPSDRIQSEMHFEEIKMESVDEEKCKDSSC